MLTYAARGIYPSMAYYSTPLLQSVVLWLRYALALAAAIALWQMRRSAFYLLAGRVAIALVLFLVSLLHSVPPFSEHIAYPVLPTPLMHALIRTISASFLAFHVCIAWYVYNITSPQRLPQRSQDQTH
jgi:hypothetical protein